VKRVSSFTAALSAALFSASAAFAAGDAITGAVEKQPVNVTAIIMFLAFVAGTLGLTYWAARQTRSTSDFYTAGGGITGFQNGLAIAGDYMSAAAFLGLSGMVFGKGVDGIFYTVGWTVGWPLILFMIAERLRNLGRFTFSDITSYRLDQTSIRSLSAFGALTVVIFYLIAQMVGAGKLIQLLFGLEYSYAVVLVGVLMVLYVTFGGMLATTWVQITKAVLLLGGCTILVILSLWHFNFDPSALLSSAIANNPSHEKILLPSSSIADPLSAISLGLALLCSPAGLPHILMRFFTVPNGAESRKSAVYASGFVGYFFLVTAVLGLGSISIISSNPAFFVDGQIGGKLIGGGNMVALHLSKAVGGDAMLGFMAAISFATILAVVSGLALAGAAAISHDLFASVICKGKANERTELGVSRIATLLIGVVAIVLGMMFQGQNLAFLVSLAFAIAASANFPVLILSMYWKGLTTRGAVAGAVTGLVSSLACVILSPAVWKTVLGHEQAIFPYDHPALFSMSAAFAMTWLVSVLDKSPRGQKEIKAFPAQLRRAQTGLGAEAAARH